MQICKLCKDHLERKRSAGPPAYAIANGNFVGHLPQRFDRLTRTDEQAISLVSPCVSLSTVTGGRCRTIKSHHYIVQNTEGPIANMLPRDITSRVRVTMVGNMTKEQIAACKRRYELNLPLCHDALDFLYASNRLYKNYLEQTDPSTDRNENIRPTSVLVDQTVHINQLEDEAVVRNVRDNSTYSTFGSAIEDGGDPSQESTWIGVSSLILQPHQQDWVDILIRKSNAFVPMVSWENCVRMFPTLFPAGCGGPKEWRQKHMSVRNWILRCLQVHGHRFETHYAFMLLAFDYLASEKARQTLYVRMNVSRVALKAAQVSQETLHEAVKYFNYLAIARDKGIKPRPPLPEVQRVIDLRKGIHTAESAYYGSNLGRMRARHDLFGLQKRFGPLQIFFTVSPDSAGSYNIAIKTGEVSKEVVDHADQALNRVLLPSRHDRKACAAKYPVECAKYFLRVMNTVIDAVLGWDQTAQRSKRGGGIFGVVRAFGAAAETQVAGDLHAHFAVWLHGFPPTSTELRETLEFDVGFRRRLIAFADAVLTTKPPCIAEESMCAACHSAGSLHSILPGVDAFRRPKPGANAPLTAECTICGTKFRDKDVINYAVDALANDQNVHIDDDVIDYEKCLPPHSTHADPLAVSLVVRDVQVHFWNHSRSCFKV